MFGIKKRTILKKAIKFGLGTVVCGPKLARNAMMLQVWVLIVGVMYIHFLYGVKKTNEEGDDGISEGARRDKPQGVSKS